MSKRRPRLGVVSWLGSGGRSLAHYAYFEFDALASREKRPAETLCGADVGPVAFREHPQMTKNDPEPCPRCLSIKPTSPR